MRHGRTMIQLITMIAFAAAAWIALMIGVLVTGEIRLALWRARTAKYARRHG